MKLAILIYGTEDKQAEMYKAMNKLQKQLNSVGRMDVDVHFYIDKGEMSTADKRVYLIKESKAAYFTFVPETFEIRAKYIKEIIKAIEKDKLSITGLRAIGIFRRKIDPTKIKLKVEKSDE